MNKRTKQILALTFALFVLAGLQSFSLSTHSNAIDALPALRATDLAATHTARSTHSRSESQRHIARSTRPERPARRPGVRDAR